MPYMVAIDAGGSKIRVLVTDQDGLPVAVGIGAGGNPQTSQNFRAHFAQAISAALIAIDRTQIVRVVAGLAGYDSGSDQEWGREVTAIDGSPAVQTVLNDTETAHFGAFRGRPGILSIQGYGSNIFALTDEGLKLTNQRLCHYASAGANAIGPRAHFAVLSGNFPEDEELMSKMCHHWNVANRAELYRLAQRGWGCTREEMIRRMSDFAPEVTAAARRGSPACLQVCQFAAAHISEGIGLLAQSFKTGPIPVALIGSSARSEIISQLVAESLARNRLYKFNVQDPECSPLAGAVLLAIEQEDRRIAKKDLTSLEHFISDNF